MFKDIFIETTGMVSNLSSREIRERLHDLKLMADFTPSIEVDGGQYLTYGRISDLGADPETFDQRAEQAIARFDGKQVASSFQEVWDNYEHAGSYFVTDVTNPDGTTETIPFGKVRPEQTMGTAIARPPGVMLGGPDFQKKLLAGSERENLKAKVRQLAQQVQSSNELSDEDRKDLLGYLAAMDAILGQENPDRTVLRTILKQLLQRVGKLTVKIGERWITNEIIDFVKDLLGGGGFF